MKVQNILLLLVTSALLRAGTPTIEFTYIPPIGSTEEVRAKTTDVDVTKYGVSMIIKVVGTYWTKPFWSTPITPFSPNGTWQNRYATGGQDPMAEQIILYVVPLDYAIPLLSGQTRIPQEIEDHAIAKAVTNRSFPGAGEITFAGYKWAKKVTGDYVWGPGPNHFGADNAYVDPQGKLHLKITCTNGVWYCGELILKESLGFGRYSFTLETNLGEFPGAIVFGFFTFDEDAGYPYREIDIEFSNGAVVGSDNPWQYVIQPYQNGSRYRFSAPAGINRSTHAFTWVSGMVSFASYENPPTSNWYDLTYQMDFTFLLDSMWWRGTTPTFSVRSPTNYVYSDGTVAPQSMYYQARLESFAENGEPEAFEKSTIKSLVVSETGNEKLHINLWLFEGAPPGNEGETFEVMISDFKFEPLDSRTITPTLKLTEYDQAFRRIQLTLPSQ